MIYPDVVSALLRPILDWALPHEEAAVWISQQEVEQEEEKLADIAIEKEQG
jgi:hypothetical protein